MFTTPLQRTAADAPSWMLLDSRLPNSQCLYLSRFDHECTCHALQVALLAMCCQWNSGIHPGSVHCYALALQYLVCCHCMSSGCNANFDLILLVVHRGCRHHQPHRAFRARYRQQTCCMTSKTVDCLPSLARSHCVTLALCSLQSCLMLPNAASLRHVTFTGRVMQCLLSDSALCCYALAPCDVPEL